MLLMLKQDSLRQLLMSTIYSFGLSHFLQKRLVDKVNCVLIMANQCFVPGTLYNSNTLEKFHTLNKRELMKKEAEKVHLLESFITI